MKIEDDAKRKHYHGFIGRQGYGFKRQFTQRKLPRSAIDHMNHKPYGGGSYVENNVHDNEEGT